MVVCRAAVFPAASSVGVARSPRVGVPSVLRVVSGGRWACAGVIRMASDVCFGGVCWGVWWGWGGAGLPVGVGRGTCRGALFLRVLVPVPAPSWFLGGVLTPCGVASGALSLRVPALTWGPSVPSCLCGPWCPLPFPCPCPAPSCCGGGGRGGVGRGRRWPRLGGGDAFPWGAGHGTVRDTRK